MTNRDIARKCLTEWETVYSRAQAKVAHVRELKKGDTDAMQALADIEMNIAATYWKTRAALAASKYRLNMLDTSIPLQVRPVQLDNPMDVAGKAVALRQMRTQTNLQDDQFAREQLMRTLSKQANGSAVKLRDLLASRNVNDRA